MPRRYVITQEQFAELEIARQKNKHKNVERRLEALLLHAEGKKRSQIAEKTGYCKSHISDLVAKYAGEGLSSIVDNHYPGNHRNLSMAEEASLLEPFKKKAELGQLVEISEIKKAYEEALGRSLESDHGIIYRLLARHDWRKVMPRSKHPKKASDEEVEASKKLKQPSVI